MMAPEDDEDDIENSKSMVVEVLMDLSLGELTRSIELICSIVAPEFIRDGLLRKLLEHVQQD